MILKKSACILLLMVFLFNTIGYKAVFLYLEKQADARIDLKIETLNEADKELITVKIPVNLPYQADWSEFESIDGEMTFKGRTYKYVKRKIVRDTLILLCIAHTEKSQLEKRSSDYYKKVNDLTAETGKKRVITQAKTDFYQANEYSSSIVRFGLAIQNNFVYAASIAPIYLPKQKMPPRHIQSYS